MAVPAWLHRILLTQGHDVTLAAVQAAARIVSDHVGMHKVYGPMANHVIKLVARGKVLDYAIRVKADAQARKNKGCGRPYSTPAWLKQGVAPLSLPAVEEDVAIYHERLLAMGHKVSLDAVEAGVRLLVRPQAEGPLFDLLVELFVKIITEHSAHVEAAEQRTLEGLWRDWRRE